MDLRIISQYSFRLRDGILPEPFFGPYGNNVPEDFGLEPPCSIDEFHARWSSSSMGVFPEQREMFLRFVSSENLLAEREKGRDSVVTDYRIIDKKGMERLVHTKIRFQQSGEGEPLAVMTNYGE